MWGIFVILVCLVSIKLSLGIVEKYNLTQQSSRESNRTATWAFNLTLDDTSQNDTSALNLPLDDTSQNDTSAFNLTLDDKSQNDTSALNLTLDDTSQNDTTAFNLTLNDTSQNDTSAFNLTLDDTSQNDTSAFNLTLDDTSQNDTSAGLQQASIESTNTENLGYIWGKSFVFQTHLIPAVSVETNSDLSTTTVRGELKQPKTYRPDDKISASKKSKKSPVSLSILDGWYDVGTKNENISGLHNNYTEKQMQEECAVANHQCVSGCNNDSGENQFCSCGILCKKSDKCCHERTEMCLSRHEETGVLTRCIENEVLVSSCDKEFSLQVFNELKERANSTILKTFLKYMNYSDVQYGCTSSDDLLQSLPVTDRATSVHYMNIFCAICNSAGSDVRFWDGHLYCPLELFLQAPYAEISKVTSVFQNLVSLKNLVGDKEEQRCVVLLGPKHGSSQRCFEVESTDSRLMGRKAGDQPSKYKTPIYKAKPKFEIFSLTFDEAKSSAFESKVLSYQSLLQSFTKLVNITETSDTAVVVERCLQIKPYIHECGECHLYFQLLQCIQLVGEPGVKTCYQSISYNYSIESNYFTITVDPEPKIEEAMDQAFQLRLSLEYTFQRTRIVRGNVYQQMDRFTNILISHVHLYDTMANVVCNMTSTQNGKSEGSNEYWTKMFFHCKDENQTLTFDKAKLANGDAENDPKMSQILKFAQNSVKVLTNATDSVKLPFKMDTSICVVLLQKMNPNSFCSTYNMGWSVQRAKNGIVGNIPLEGLITIICCALSIIGLLFRLAFQNIVTVYKSYPGKVQFSLCLSLLLSYCFFLVGGMVADSSLECRIVGMLTHFAFLSALFWMNVTAFEIWRTFRHWSNQVVSRGTTSLVVAGIYAVGVPVMIVTGALIVEELDPTSDFSPEYGTLNCWLNGGFAVAVYFVAPCSILCCFNVLFLGLTLRGLRRQRTAISEVKFSSSLTAINDTTIVVKISLLVGITWLLGLLAAVVNKRVLWIIFTVINASLGFFISIVLVCNKRVYLAVKAKCMCYNSDSVVSTQVKKH